jgi:gamma-D-glutamyl-L-lysine dipeptidyl-peptidase
VAEILACALDVAPIHRQPDPTSEQVTQALRGEPLTIEERRGGWARVRTAYDYPGWIAEAAVGGEPGGGWLPRETGGDPVDKARSYLGAPYLWGGMSERGIDCSGLVHMAYRRTGRLVPRDADQQEEAAQEIAESEARHGDLATYGRDGVDGATHIAFWLGEGRILHASDRDGVHAVVDEDEPEAYRTRRRRFGRL